MDSIEINSTVDGLEKFKESVAWQDICREIKIWAEGYKGELGTLAKRSSIENPSTASVLMQIGWLEGLQDAIDYMLGLPDHMIEILGTEEVENG